MRIHQINLHNHTHNRTFATVEVKRRRYIAAWWLLAVFLPMLVLSSVHIHTSCADTPLCSACLHHTEHSGHVASGQSTMHACLLCQVLHLTFLKGTAIVVQLPLMLTIAPEDGLGQQVVLRSIHLKAGRAPPFT